MPSLSEIPFLDRYRAREGQIRQQGLQEQQGVLQQAGLLAQLQAQMQAQAEKQKAAQRQEQFRPAIFSSSWAAGVWTVEL